MPHPSEAKATPAPSNIQDAFLNHARREGEAVRIQLMDGRELEGRIRQFDRFAVIVGIDGGDQLIFKHAIVSIALPQSVPGGYRASE
jgi:host factor-I protein